MHGNIFNDTRTSHSDQGYSKKKKKSQNMYFEEGFSY